MVKCDMQKTDSYSNENIKKIKSLADRTVY